MRRLYKFLRLRSTDRSLLIRVVLLLVAIKGGLWLLPLRTLQRLLARMSRVDTSRSEANHLAPEHIVWAVTMAGRYISSTCLVRALAAQVLLEREGVPACLHIGLLKGEGGRLQGHAWLESRGKVVIGGADLERYTPFATFRGESP